MNMEASREEVFSVRVDKGAASTEGFHSSVMLKYIIQSAVQPRDNALPLLPLLLVFLLSLTTVYFLFSYQFFYTPYYKLPPKMSLGFLSVREVRTERCTLKSGSTLGNI
jgi:hypothetical protein